MFQYISCYSLSMTSKHYKYFQPKFQYISCYSLSRKYPWGNQREIGVSIHLMLLFILRQKTTDRTDGCFNTSHVTLYRRWTFQNRWQWTFQYISCYSLSVYQRYYNSNIMVSIHLMLLFIRFVITFFFEMVCFNTSHVTLYQDIVSWCGNSSLFQYISCYSLSQNSCRTEDSLMSFNTSHITLYRSLFRTSSDSSIVSIHLMLLFIGFRTETVISCIWVSIHLMLLFIIPALPGPERTVASFNTSLFIILARFIP